MSIYSTFITISPAKRVVFYFFTFQKVGQMTLSGHLLLGLGTLGTVLGAALQAVGDTGGIECTADDVITYTGEVLHTTTANEHDGVLLQVVTLSGNVTVDLLLVGQTNTGYLTHSRIRLLRRRCVDTHTDTAALRTVVQRG
jgi:hypothetical protein